MCAYSWRVPLSVGSEDLRIVAVQPLGPLGSWKSEPTIVAWKWYYHAGSVPLWLLVALLIAGPAENRQRQAWLIVLPLAVVALLASLLPRLLGAAADSAEGFGIAALSCAVAWAAVWLLGCRFAAWRGILRFIAALVLMLAVGGLSCLTHLGLDNAEEMRGFLVAHGVASTVLLLGMMLAGRSCRNGFDRKRFTRRLLSRLVLVAMMPVSLEVILSLLLAAFDPIRLPFAAILQLAILSLAAAAALYVLNLPFMLLAFRCPFYQARFHALFCPNQSAGSGPEAGTEESPRPAMQLSEMRGP